MSFDKNMRAERIRRNWTQQQAADHLRIPVKNLQSYERGTAHPRWNALLSIIQGYQIPANKLFNFLFHG